MFKNFINKIRKIFPYLCLSLISGVVSALLIISFKFTTNTVIKLSTNLYNTVRSNPLFFPILIIASGIIGLASSYILSICQSCRGGGIPTSIAAIRGIITFKWYISILVLPISALLTFFCGVPLGTEGPCVQIGTAIGDGVVKCFGGKKHLGWRRYLMTGGATAGFSIATTSPITSIIFSIEELHKRFSPILLIGASLSVTSAHITVKTLSLVGINTDKLFNISLIESLPIKSFYIPLIVGIVCGISAILFTKLYHFINKLVNLLLNKLSIKIIFPVLFMCTSVVGFFLIDTLGTGHTLVDKLLSTRSVWYVLVLLFLVRAVIMMLANTSGVTGGIFLPTLAFGAILGSICANVAIYFNIIDPKYYPLIVIFGISSFLGATSRIPITACVFAIEALGCINNIFPIIISTTIAFLVIKLSGLEDLTDTVINAKRIHND